MTSSLVYFFCVPPAVQCSGAYTVNRVANMSLTDCCEERSFHYTQTFLVWTSTLLFYSVPSVAFANNVMLSERNWTSNSKAFSWGGESSFRMCNSVSVRTRSCKLFRASTGFCLVCGRPAVIVYFELLRARCFCMQQVKRAEELDWVYRKNIWSPNFQLSNWYLAFRWKIELRERSLGGQWNSIHLTARAIGFTFCRFRLVYCVTLNKQAQTKYIRK